MRGLRAWSWIGYALIIGCSAPIALVERLPLRELPQYAALSRMLVQLHDRRYGFAEYYELDLWRGASVLPLWLWGQLSAAVGVVLATRLVVLCSVLVGQLGLCAVLRAQRKPAVLALLGVPFAYANLFYLGLVPALLSLGLAWWSIACLMRARERRAARLWLLALSCLLPLAHPLGVGVVLVFAAFAILASGRMWRPMLRASWPLAPLLPGASYWARAALHADGVAAFDQPGLAQRLMRAPQLLFGGFQGHGEAWRLAATLVLWIYLCRPYWTRRRRADVAGPRQPSRPVEPLTAACWGLAAASLLGYLLLPGSTWNTSAIFPRAGAVLMAWLPVLVPAAGLRLTRRRGPLLLIALALWTAWSNAAQLARFSTEAAPLDAVLARVPPRPKLLYLAYDNQGQIARSSPYLHSAAYAQAERGGFLALSRVDYAWTAPLRRRKDARVPAAVYGSEWEPALLQSQPALLEFYDAVLVSGKEPREMTILMNTPFRLAAHSGMFLLYLRP